MLVISPARLSDQVTLPTEAYGKVISASGSEDYGQACFNLFQQVLGVDHWALFQYPTETSMSCLATGSRTKAVEAKVNIEKFVGRCHSFDPSLAALKLQSPSQHCLVNIEIGDIKHREYRQCFEATDVRERVSYFTRTMDNLYQLSVYRTCERGAFTQSEMHVFATLASLMLATTLQHETRRRTALRSTEPMTIAMLQKQLGLLPGGLSERECEVCARAVAGMTIEGTALDLDIAKTSVITYRQRAYQKLAISSLNELVARLHNVVSVAAAPCGVRRASLRWLNS